MKAYTENIPEWMQLLFDDIREESYESKISSVLRK